MKFKKSRNKRAKSGWEQSSGARSPDTSTSYRMTQAPSPPPFVQLGTRKDQNQQRTGRVWWWAGLVLANTRHFLIGQLQHAQDLFTHNVETEQDKGCGIHHSSHHHPDHLLLKT